MHYELQICIDNEHPHAQELKKYYENLKPFYDGDSGVDLLTPSYLALPEEGVAPYEVQTIDFGVKCAMFCNFYDAESQTHKTKPSAYFLIPRSSFSSTKFLFTNSIGLIDRGYRGNLKAKVLNLLPYNNSMIEAGGRHFQIAAPNLEPVSVKIVDSLPPSERGTGGFGSTGK